MKTGFANLASATPIEPATKSSIELTSRVESFAQMRVAIASGANRVRLDMSLFKQTQEEKAELNIESLISAIRFAHGFKCKVSLQLAASSDPARWADIRNAVQLLASIGVDSLELSDLALILYCSVHFPQLAIHCLVVDDMNEDNGLFVIYRQLRISRLVLPHTLASTDLLHAIKSHHIEVEIHSRTRLQPKLGKCNITAPTRRKEEDSYVERCATIEAAANEKVFASSPSADPNILQQLPKLADLGINAITVDPLAPYDGDFARTLQVWRAALDECASNSQRYEIRPDWIRALSNA